MTLDLDKQSIDELGTFLSLSRKYEGIDKETIYTVYKEKCDFERNMREEKRQKKIDQFNTELKDLFEQGYYKGSILTKMCMSFSFSPKITTGTYRLVLTGKVIQFPSSTGYYSPMFCYYNESDPLKKVDVIGLSLGPVLKVETLSPPLKTFEEIVNSSRGCEYFLE